MYEHANTWALVLAAGIDALRQRPDPACPATAPVPSGYLNLAAQFDAMQAAG